MRKPLNRSFLQSSLDGAGWPAERLSGLTIPDVIHREVCIGKRSVPFGRSARAPGSGSYDDPYDGTTAAQVTAILLDVTKAAQPKTFIRFRDGFFLHYGHAAPTDWYLRPFCWLSGEGIGETILRLDPSVVIPANGITSIVTDYAVESNNIRIYGITVDSNYDALSNPNQGPIQGISLGGSNNTIERVRFTGGWGINSLNREHFGLALLGHVGGTAPTFNQKVLNCTIDGYRGDYGVGIGVAGTFGTGGNLSVGSVISGNRVIGMAKQGVDVFVGTHSVGIGTGGGVVENNEITDCQVGIYAENGHDIQIRNNTIRSCREVGIHFLPADASFGTDGWIKRPSIIGNSIELRDDMQRRWGIQISDSNDGLRETHNATVIGNTVYEKLTGSAIADAFGSFYLSMGNFSGRGHIIMGNHFDAAMDNTPFITADTLSFGNRGLDGAVLTHCPDQFAQILPSDVAFASTWNGITTIPPSKNAVYDRLNAMEKTTTFTPTTSGWYQIMTSNDGAFGGVMRVSATYGTGFSDHEFAFDMFGYLENAGTIQQFRANHANGATPIITKVRMHNNANSIVYMDLFIDYVTTPGPVRVAVTGLFLPELVVSPVVGAVPIYPDSLIQHTFSRGFDSTYGTIFDAPTVFVDKGSGSDTGGERLSANLPFATIQAALDAAVDGDEIIIQPGTYDEEVTVKAGTYVITLKHGAIWKQTTDAACLKSANVTCDVTINGDLLLEDDGAACIAMITGCPNVIIRVNGTLDARDAIGTAYGFPCAVYQSSGKIYIKGEVFATDVAFYTLTSAANSLIDMTGNVTAYGYIVKLLGTAGNAIFRNGVLTSTDGTEAIQFIDRSIEFYRCTIRAFNLMFFVGGTGTVTLHEFCHLVSGAAEISDSLTELILDGISYTNKPKEAGTTLSGGGYLVVEYEASTGVLMLS